MGSPILQLTNINKSFSGVRVLNDVSLSVNKGEVHGLIGENGAGKSTLMKILSGAYSKDSGEIIIDGKTVNVKNPDEAKREGISIIYQELSLVPQLNAAENIFLGRWIRNPLGLVDWSKMFRETNSILDRIGIKIDSKMPVRNLSLAQCQLIEIARAIYLKSKIIIMDEPTSSLTDKEIKILFEIIADLRKQDIAVIYISHRLDELFEITDSVTVLKDGCITGYGKTSDTNKEELVRLMVGRSIQELYPARNIEPGETLLEVRNLSAGKHVRDISFEVRRGEILGFAGLVGAGRTETMRAVFCADHADSGEILIEGRKVDIKSPLDAIKSGIAFATEDRRRQGLVLCLSVGHNIIIASPKTVRKKIGTIDRNKEKGIAEKYIKELRIKTKGPKQKVVNLSGGNQQKVVVAKWLNTSAKIYIFDEPTRGIDVGAKAEIYNLLHDLAKGGAGIIVVSSELPEVIGICDRIVVMNEGRIVGEVPGKEATEENIMSYAIGG